MTKYSYRGLFAVAALSIALSSGCMATRRYVRNTVDPVSGKLSDVDKRTAENSKGIQDLDDKTQRNIARVDEKAGAADAHAGDAARLANEAGTKASQANDKALEAHDLAENDATRTGKLEQTVDNLDNYHEVTKTVVLFPFNKSTLTDDGKQELDQVAEAISKAPETGSGAKRYVIQVQGFTDSSGASDYNDALSQRRAATVVRYLVEEKNVPLYRIHTIGLGKDMPADSNRTLAGRKKNRRVEVTLLTPDLSGAAATHAQTQTSSLADNH